MEDIVSDCCCPGPDGGELPAGETSRLGHQLLAAFAVRWGVGMPGCDANCLCAHAQAVPGAVAWLHVLCML